MTISFHGNALKFTNGDRKLEIEQSANLSELIDALGERYGTLLKEHLLGHETCLILVNGKGTQSTGGLSTVLNGDDNVDILPFVGAG